MGLAVRKTSKQQFKAFEASMPYQEGLMRPTECLRSVRELLGEEVEVSNESFRCFVSEEQIFPAGIRHSPGLWGRRPGLGYNTETLTVGLKTQSRSVGCVSLRGWTQ